MKIAELFGKGKTVFSCEVFPPKKTSPVDSIYKTLDGLKDIRPDFISVTYGAGGSSAVNQSTQEIASIIQNQYHITAMAHLTCVACTRGEAAELLAGLKRNGVENVLALRGDRNPYFPPKTDFLHADELVSFIHRRGDFGVSGACYPEGHPESPDMIHDIRYLKQKVDAGAQHLVSQLFFDNEDFFQRKSTVSDENGNEYEDNDDRSIFYVRGVLETVKKLRWIPDVIHCHGWMSALTALYIKRMYADDPCLRNAKIVYSIYNDDFKNPLNKDFATKLKADGAKEADLKLIKADTSFVGLTKLAIDFADGVIQGSETINQEVLDYISAKKDTPFLPYQSPETYMDEFNKFYDVVLDSNTK